MLADGHCRSCGAPIKWVLTTTGKNMPLDPIPTVDGNCWVERWDHGVPVVQVTSGFVPGRIPMRYTSHFASCPNADEWRKR